MIQRYTHPDMGAIWSDQRRYETWLDVELAAADAMAEAGLIPREAAAELRAKADFDPQRIEEIEAVTQHDVIAFTTAVAEKVGPAARYLHFGLTSSDVIDTAQASRCARPAACRQEHQRLMEAVRERADEHRRTPMIGRTHGARRADDLRPEARAVVPSSARPRSRPCAPGSRVGREDFRGGGTFAPRPVDRGARLRAAGARAAPVSSGLQRDRHAELMSVLAITAASLEKFALEIRGLQKTKSGSRGRSARDRRARRRCRTTQPDRVREIVGLARLLRERDGRVEHRSLARRDISPRRSSGSSSRQFHRPRSHAAPLHPHRRGMVVYRADAGPGPLARSRVLGHALLELAKRGVSREQAYEWVQRNAMRAFHDSAFKTAGDPT
jgi:adenylosuccinate lyase